MVEETGRDMNAAIADGARAGKGMGEALADDLARRPSWRPARPPSCSPPRSGASRHRARYARGRHHPSAPAADGAALGATSYRDFKRLAASLPTLHDGGVVLNVGSAVVMPEVFPQGPHRRAQLSGGKPTGFTACDCDMQRHTDRG